MSDKKEKLRKQIFEKRKYGTWYDSLTLVNEALNYYRLIGNEQNLQYPVRSYIEDIPKPIRHLFNV